MTEDFVPKKFVAWFPVMSYATEFAARLREDGWFVEKVEQKGRTVTFQTDRPTDPEYFPDMLQTVGYYGSTQKRKATLNGVKAPISY